jgi:hypothetical protein
MLCYVRTFVVRRYFDSNSNPFFLLGLEAIEAFTLWKKRRKGISCGRVFLSEKTLRITKRRKSMVFCDPYTRVTVCTLLSYCRTLVPSTGNTTRSHGHSLRTVPCYYRLCLKTLRIRLPFRYISYMATNCATMKETTNSYGTLSLGHTAGLGLYAAITCTVSSYYAMDFRLCQDVKYYAMEIRLARTSRLLRSLMPGPQVIMLWIFA